MNMEQFTVADYQPAAIAGRIQRLRRRIRTRSRTLSGDRLTQPHGDNPMQVAKP